MFQSNRQSFVSLPGVMPNRLKFSAGIQPFGRMQRDVSTTALDNSIVSEISEKLTSLLEKVDWLADRVSILEHAVQDTHFETKSHFKVTQSHLEDLKRNRHTMSVEEAVISRSPLPEFIADELASLSDYRTSTRATSASASLDFSDCNRSSPFASFDRRSSTLQKRDNRHSPLDPSPS